MPKNKTRKEYFFSGYNGGYLDISSLPNYQEVAKSDVTNKPYTFIPDNNVCIHVSDFNIRKQDEAKRAKAKSFLEYVHRSNITVNPTWGLLERASKPGTLNLDKDKLKDFEQAFWRKLYHYSDNSLFSQSIKSIELDKSILYTMYVYLLKIKLIIVEKKPSSNNAKANLTELYDFMNEMQFFSVIMWQIAIGVFGGDNIIASRLIKHGGKNKKENIFKDLWGAAWDVYYLQLPHWFYGVAQVNNSYPQVIFATDDKACGMIGSIMKVTGCLDYGNFTNNQTLTNFDFPYWKNQDSFLFKTSWKINNEIIKRSIKRNSLSEVEFENELESIVDNSSRQINKLTQQLKTISNKGFDSQKIL